MVYHSLLPVYHVLLPVSHNLFPVDHILLPVYHILLPVYHILLIILHHFTTFYIKYGLLYIYYLFYINNDKEVSLCHKLQFSNPYIFLPDCVNLWNFKLWLFDLTEFMNLNIWGLRHGVVKTGIYWNEKIKNFAET